VKTNLKGTVWNCRTNVPKNQLVEDSDNRLAWDLFHASSFIKNAYFCKYQIYLLRNIQIDRFIQPLNDDHESASKRQFNGKPDTERSRSVLIIRCLHPSTPFLINTLILLDEHTAALDPKTASKVINLSRQVIAKYWFTTLMVLHFAFFILQM
jgi:hypothetical protein